MTLLSSPVIRLTFYDASTHLPIKQLPRVSTGFILLGGLFFYDIFWVFGTDVMITVAKSFEAPIKLVFPQDLLQNGAYFCLVASACLLMLDFKLTTFGFTLSMKVLCRLTTLPCWGLETLSYQEYSLPCS